MSGRTGLLPNMIREWNTCTHAGTNGGVDRTAEIVQTVECVPRRTLLQNFIPYGYPVALRNDRGAGLVGLGRIFVIFQDFSLLFFGWRLHRSNLREHVSIWLTSAIALNAFFDQDHLFADKRNQLGRK